MDPTGGGGVDGDAHVEIVRGFRNPEDAWRSQGYINEREELTFALFVNRHAGRRTRNAHRIALGESIALFSRSVNGRGTQEAAQVAAMRVTGPKNMLDQLLGSPPSGAPINGGPQPPPPKKTFLGFGGGKS